jgi:beta-glucanase (GH16 family)
MLENRINEQPIAGDNDNVGWPNPGAGEIDVWEWVGKEPNTYVTNFYNAGGGSCGSLQKYSYPGGAAQVQQWHDYAIEWDSSSVKLFINDTLVYNHNVSSCPQYKEPMFVLINLAMGGTFGGPISGSLAQATMEIDYVAHCNPSSSNSASRCNEATPRASDSSTSSSNNSSNLTLTSSGSPVTSFSISSGGGGSAAPIFLVTMLALVVYRRADRTQTRHCH